MIKVPIFSCQIIMQDTSSELQHLDYLYVHVKCFETLAILAFIRNMYAWSLEGAQFSLFCLSYCFCYTMWWNSVINCTALQTSFLCHCVRVVDLKLKQLLPVKTVKLNQLSVVYTFGDVKKMDLHTNEQIFALQKLLQSYKWKKELNIDITRKVFNSIEDTFPCLQLLFKLKIFF